jgi:Uma2 family endonuclease
MSSLRQRYISAEEYLEQEREAEFKSEYYTGEIFAMSGASRRHNVVTTNITSEIRRQLKGGSCEVYASDMRVEVSDHHYVYPDVVVACGEIRFKDGREDTLLNPTVIIEVLSPSTEKHDRGLKLREYQTLESLQEYLIVSQDKPHIERYHRQPDGNWLATQAKDMTDEVFLSSIGCRLPLSEVYDKAL